MGNNRQLRPPYDFILLRLSLGRDYWLILLGHDLHGEFRHKVARNPEKPRKTVNRWLSATVWWYAAMIAFGQSFLDATFPLRLVW